jgi:hypothetical protein
MLVLRDEIADFGGRICMSGFGGLGNAAWKEWALAVLDSDGARNCEMCINSAAAFERRILTSFKQRILEHASCKLACKMCAAVKGASVSLCIPSKCAGSLTSLVERHEASPYPALLTEYSV